MHADPILPRLVAAILVVLVIGALLRRFNQPHVIAYLIAGVSIGPHGLGVFEDIEAISRLGDLGLILLLFFVGMEMSLPRLASNWRIAAVGTVLQIGLSVLLVWAIGAWFHWPIDRIVLVGFVISLSSTAVAVSMLSMWGHMDSELGRDVMGILLVQDIAVAPMLLTLGVLSDRGSMGVVDLALPVVGAILVVGVGAWLATHERVRLPFGQAIAADHELQVFAAALLCLSAALVTSLLGLSTALGAFLAGIVVSSANETAWVSRSLEPFRVILVALFFVSIGLLVDLDFARANWVLITMLVGALLMTNTFVNAGIVRMLGRSWPHALFAGSVLAQTGDFSFVLAAIGLQGGLITTYGYQLAVSVIFGSLVLSPFWVMPFRSLFDRPQPPEAA